MKNVYLDIAGLLMSEETKEALQRLEENSYKLIYNKKLNAYADTADEISWLITDSTETEVAFDNADRVIALANASDSVKAASDHIVESVADEGLVEAVNDIILEKDVYDQLMKITDVSTDGILGYERFLLIERAAWMDLFIEGKMLPPIQIDWQMSSSCNLNCRWCVGQNVTGDNGMVMLGDKMTPESIRTIAKKFIDLRIEGLGIDTIQFSGFTGEPLVQWENLKEAITILKEGNLRIGIFTNGTLMGPDTWDKLTDIESVHVSVDGGRTSWADIKRPNNKQIVYPNLIENIRGIVSVRNQKNSSTEINTGFTITRENIGELESTIQDLVEAGADSICIKYDITGSEELERATDYNEIIRSCQEKYSSENFKVLVMHDEAPKKYTSRWNCQNGCYYRYFFCTIGSDGSVYPCDYQTLKECPQFGNIKDESFESVYRKKDEQWDELVTKKCEFKNVCPPLAEVINPYLSEVDRLKKKYGIRPVASAVKEIRKNFR